MKPDGCFTASILGQHGYVDVLGLRFTLPEGVAAPFSLLLSRQQHDFFPKSMTSVLLVVHWLPIVPERWSTYCLYRRCRVARCSCGCC